MSANQWPEGPSLFSIGPKNTNLLEIVSTSFLSSFVQFRSAVAEDKSKMFQSIKSQVGHLPIHPKSTILVENLDSHVLKSLK